MLRQRFPSRSLKPLPTHPRLRQTSRGQAKRRPVVPSDRPFFWTSMRLADPLAQDKCEREAMNLIYAAL